MKETTKARLNKLKQQAKKHGPAVLGAVGTVVASIVAEKYRRELVQLQTIDPDAWPVIEVTPNCMKDIREGATLKYREAKNGTEYYSQMTTLDEFPDEADEAFAKFKATGKFYDDSDN